MKVKQIFSDMQDLKFFASRVPFPGKVLEGMSLESEKVNEEREKGMELSRQVIPQHSLDDGEGRTQINKYKVIVIKINRHRGY